MEELILIQKFSFQAIIPEEQPSFAFGVKHSPYMYSGKQVSGDRWVSSKTEAVSQNTEEFRPRSGTYTRDQPTVLRSTAAIRQSQAVAWVRVNKWDKSVVCVKILLNSSE